MKKGEDRLGMAMRDEFDYWIFYLCDVLEDFLDFLPLEVSEKLDFSVESLDVIENWILDRYSTLDAILSFDQSSILNALRIYIGETFRKIVGGHWDIELEDSDFVFFQEPVITNFDTYELKTSVSPCSLVTASVDRRTGHYLRTVIGNHLELLSNKKN
jgi:hypothetical protein